MKLKKIIFTLGVIVMGAMPLVATIACSSNKEQKKTLNKGNIIDEDKNVEGDQIKDVKPEVFEENEPIYLEAKEQLNNFLEKIRSEDLNLNDFSEKAASEIRYINYLFKLQQKNNSSIDYEIFVDNDKLKLKVFWPFVEDYQKSISKNVQQEETIDRKETLGRTIQVAHGDHFHPKFVTWIESPPRNEEEQKIYQEQISKKIDPKKGYTYTFGLKNSKKIDWRNVIIETDLFSRMISDEQKVDFSEGDKKVEDPFNPDTIAFQKDYVAPEGFILRKVKVDERELDLGQDGYVEKFISYDDLKVVRYKVSKDNFLDTLKAHVEKNQENNLVNQVLESIEKLENSNLETSFLDKYFYDRGLDSKISMEKNYFQNNWAIKDSWKELLFEIIEQLIETKEEKVGFDEVFVNRTILEWYLDSKSKVPTQFLESDSTTPEQKEIVQKAQLIMNSLDTSKELLSFSNKELIELLNKINNSQEKYDEFVEKISSYFNDNLSSEWRKKLQESEGITDIKSILKQFWNLKINFPKKINKKLTKRKFYWFEKNGNKNYVKDILQLASSLSLYRIGSSSPWGLDSGLKIYKEKALHDKIMFHKTTNKIVQGEVYNPLSVRFDQNKEIDLGVIFYPEIILAPEEEEDVVFYLSYNERAFKTEKARKFWADSNKNKSFLEI